MQAFEKSLHLCSVPGHPEWHSSAWSLQKRRIFFTRILSFILAETGCYCKFAIAAQPCFCLSGLRSKIQATRLAGGC
jgi:hypothetical protein